jgi:hypothetical protein
MLDCSFPRVRAAEDRYLDAAVFISPLDAPVQKGDARCANFEIRALLAGTLGSAISGRVSLIIWCRDCSRQVEPNPEEMAARHCAETPMPDSRERLI